MRHTGRPPHRLLGNRPIPHLTLTQVGVTGTDTGVGKTVVTSAIVAALHAMGIRAAPMKPVESGGNNDATTLRRCAGDLYPLEQVGPISLPDPVAPLVAARRAKQPIDIGVLDRALDALIDASEIVIVEGAGGILVPITEDENFATLFAKWWLDVIIVAPNRLGAVNHSLLTIDAARAQGLDVRAVVLNTVADADRSLADQTNQALIAELRDVPVFTFPYVSTPDDVGHLALVGRELVEALILPPR